MVFVRVWNLYRTTAWARHWGRSYIAPDSLYKIIQLNIEELDNLYGSPDPLKTKLVELLFKNSVRTSKRTPNFTVTSINFLTLFKEIIAVYVENHPKPINTKCSITDSFGSYSYRSALKG
jgi:hypothetical protein